MPAANNTNTTSTRFSAASIVAGMITAALSTAATPGPDAEMVTLCDCIEVIEGELSTIYNSKEFDEDERPSHARRPAPLDEEYAAIDRLGKLPRTSGHPAAETHSLRSPGLAAMHASERAIRGPCHQATLSSENGIQMIHQTSTFHDGFHPRTALNNVPV